MAFEKNGQPAKSSPKQLVIVGVLGVVLVVVVLRFILNRPSDADAAAVQGTSDLAVPSINPADAIRDLNDDPTSRLLRGTPDISPELDAVPPNPFKMSPELVSKLIKPVDTEVAVVHNDNGDPAPVVEKVDPDSLKLTGIVNSGRDRLALVNGQIVHVGSVLERIRIVAIQSDRLVCQPARGGATFEIPLTKDELK